jgi:hypothetical protein
MSAFGSFIAKVKAGGAQALLGAMHHSGKFDSALKNMTVTSIDTGRPPPSPLLIAGKAQQLTPLSLCLQGWSARHFQ